MLELIGGIIIVCLSIVVIHYRQENQAIKSDIDYLIEKVRRIDTEIDEINENRIMTAVAKRTSRFHEDYGGYKVEEK